MGTTRDSLGAAAREANRRGLVNDGDKRGLGNLADAADAYRHMSRAKCARLRSVVAQATGRISSAAGSATSYTDDMAGEFDKNGYSSFMRFGTQ